MLSFLRRWLGGSKPSERSITWDQAASAGLVTQRTSAGVNVTAENSLTSSPVFAAVRMISTAAASLPLCVYRKLPDDGREKASDLPLYDLLHDNPNEESVPSILWAAFFVNLLLHGRGAFEIERNGAGQPLALWIIPGQSIKPARDSIGQLYYEIHTTNGVQPLLPEHCFYVPYFSFDGVTGKGIIEYARECIGLNKAMESGAGGLFANLTAPSGSIETPPGLSETARQNIRKSIEASNSGTGKVGRLLMLEEGVKYNPFQVNNDQYQWIEGRTFGVQEVARFFNISPTKLADLGRATWSNLESENASFIENTLQPLLLPVEQEAKKKLMTPAERKSLYVEALMEARLRGLTQDRYNSYSVGITAGFMLPSEARRMENWPAIPGIDERPRPGTAPATVQPAADTPVRSADQARDEHGRFAGSGGGSEFDKELEKMKAKAAVQVAELTSTTPLATAEPHAIDAMVKGGAKEIFRGDANVANAKAVMGGKDIVGQGDYGHGRYYSTTPDTAERYAAGVNGDAKGVVMRAALKPDAKIVRIEDIERQHSADTEAGKIHWSHNVSNYAREKGYDAISVEHKGYLNVINPHAMVVQNTPHTTLE